MPLIPATKDAARTLWDATRGNAGQAGVSGSVFVLALLYAGWVEAQPPPEALDAIAAAGGLDPWLLAVVAGLQGLSTLGASIKGWASARSKEAEVDKQRLDDLEEENRQLREERASLRTRLEVAAAVDAALDKVER